MQTSVSSPTYPAAQGQTLDPAAKAQRRNKIIYWILTVLMFVPGTVGAFAEAFTSGPASIVKIMLALGFPLYLMKILGMFKILGGLAILTGKLPRMKEWAYAGFAIEFLGATASHVITGDVKYALFPFSFFVVLIITYLLWHKTAATALPFERAESGA
ncbi:DoxX family protein [soil metagenome]